MFRKLLYDKIGGYGVRTYVLVGAFLFALFHANLSQLSRVGVNVAEDGAQHKGIQKLRQIGVEGFGARLPWGYWCL